MYKPKEKLIKSEIKDQFDNSMLFDNSMFYSCICDVDCNEGTFEKGSLVKIDEEHVVTPSGIRIREGIRIYDMDEAVTQRQSIYGSEDNSDIPVGVTERNFAGVFREEKELSEALQNEMDVKTDKCGFLRKIHTFGEVPVGLAFIIAGFTLVIDTYRFLFAEDFKAKECLFLWSVLAFGVLDFLNTFVLNKLADKYEKEYKLKIVRIYEDWKDSRLSAEEET